ncbi:Neuroglian [Folsomia candida]|uniref:Neuroglian n=1 Tax=Folsomia candida TaxID=158441 RepID=A0A226DXR2_FOLCA|nr:Neuroglian [Folsomia candida]
MSGILFLFFFLLLLPRSLAQETAQSPPSIVNQPPAGELLVPIYDLLGMVFGLPFTLPCEATGEPTPTYIWTKNGAPFNWQETGRYSQTPGSGTLYLGVATSNAVLVRKSEMDPFLRMERRTFVVEEGSPLNLTCHAPYAYPKPTLYWVLVNEHEMLNITDPRITTDQEKGTLWFSNVTLADRSTTYLYYCASELAIRYERNIGSPVYLGVRPVNSSDPAKIYPPVFQYVSKTQMVALRGGSVSLWCIVSGTPLPDIKWVKKNSLFPNNTERLNHGKTLQINDIDFKDQGSYYCYASNGIGSPISYVIHLTVEAVPYFTTEPENQNLLAEGETAKFQCEAGGRPAPQITWIHNGKHLAEAAPNPRRHQIRNVIFIQNVTKSDIGNYGCNATNRLGYVYKDFYLNVVVVDRRVTEISEIHQQPTGWIIGLSVTIPLLLIIFILVLVFKRARAGNYAVDETTI